MSPVSSDGLGSVMCAACSGTVHRDGPGSAANAPGPAAREEGHVTDGTSDVSSSSSTPSPRGAYATGVQVPAPIRCSPDAEENGCSRRATVCTCTYLHGCSEDEAGCCFCAHSDVYAPCPTFGFGCGPGCDCCTPYQQRQVVRMDDHFRRHPVGKAEGRAHG